MMHGESRVGFFLILEIEGMPLVGSKEYLGHCGVQGL